MDQILVRQAEPLQDLATLLDVDVQREA